MFGDQQAEAGGQDQDAAIEEQPQFPVHRKELPAINPTQQRRLLPGQDFAVFKIIQRLLHTLPP